MNWFKRYLSERNMRVKLSIRSDQYPVEYGTPQGSCLGPLIFLVFCNDIHLHLTHMQCIQFADDTTLYLDYPDPATLVDRIKFNLNTLLQDWFRANKLTLNVEKSVCLVFNKKTQKERHKINIIQ